MNTEITIDKYNRELEKRDQQIHCLMQITEAINRNASITALFDIYAEGIQTHYAPRSVTLCVQDLKKWRTYSTQKKVSFADYKHHFNYYSKNKNALHTSNIGDIYIPVYHKDQLIALAHFTKLLPESKEEIKFLKTITNFIAIAIENKRLSKEKREKEQYKSQLSLARKIQLSLMPKNLLDTRELEFETLYIPHNEISGDYFDYFHIENSNISIFCIADVAGKGIPAAILMANLQASLRRLSINFTDIVSLINGLNGAVYETTLGDRLITIFLAVYDVKKNELQYVNAGHNYPILQQKGKKICFLKEGTIPLGVIKKLPEIKVGKLLIEEETVILSYTDGLEELRNSDGNMMGYDKIIENLENLTFGNIDAIKDKIEVFIENFKENEPILDDITVLLCKIKPNGIR